MEQPKFRGFSKETNSWHYGHGWFKTDYTERYKLERDIEDGAILYTDSYPVECELKSMGQYIGINDINGDEIYEGDIVHVKHFYKNREHIGKVIYSINRFEVESFYFPHYDDPSNAFEAGMSTIEVIGNIYENPDLLISDEN
jgi:uncharacterized phage protein (TIGR01671 family)